MDRVGDNALVSRRKAAMAVLVHAQPAEILRCLEAVSIPHYVDLREPENGLVMVRGRARAFLQEEAALAMHRGARPEGLQAPAADGVIVRVSGEHPEAADGGQGREEYNSIHR